MSDTGLTYQGPSEIQCPEQCEVPAGVRLTEYFGPDPRHAWSDFLRCPNDCGLRFLMSPTDLGDGHE